MGGGPAGLYYGLLHKKSNPEDEVIIVDRNLPNSTFGWGVVFSDITMQNLYKVDEKSAQIINDALNHWDDIEIFFKGEKHRSTGHGFIGIGRLKLLNILQERAAELGVTLVYDKKFIDDEDIVKEYNPDLIIVADGLHSSV
jgi:anthraniloyl-CoA monooxygenase